MQFSHVFPVSKRDVYVTWCESIWGVSLLLFLFTVGVDLGEWSSCRAQVSEASNWLWNGTNLSQPTALSPFDVSHYEPQQEPLMKAFIWETVQPFSYKVKPDKSHGATFTVGLRWMEAIIQCYYYFDKLAKYNTLKRSKNRRTYMVMGEKSNMKCVY